MTKPTTRNVLLVFIASPSDLADERKALYAIVQELNSTFRAIAWQIDLLGWEDTMPGAARPQEIINKDVDACQLFIGALWKRWGQPTGSYSSGFEEEFERAVKRRTETTEPEVWLFFKRVESDLLQDQGPQLKLVLDFKRGEIERWRVLFKDFDDFADWQKRLRIWCPNSFLRDTWNFSSHWTRQFHSSLRPPLRQVHQHQRSSMSESRRALGMNS